MGYCVEMLENEFSFKKENADNVVGAVKVWAKENINERKPWISVQTLLEAEDVESIFEEIRFPLVLKDEKYIIDWFIGEKMGCEDEIFKAIAEFVEDGYIEMLGEDGDRWRYVFKDGKFEYKSATITFE